MAMKEKKIMRKMRKLASLLLAMVMVLSLGVTAMAADTDTYTITITYEAYQIFTGDLAETYTKYAGTAAPTDGTQLYTYDDLTDKYTL